MTWQLQFDGEFAVMHLAGQMTPSEMARLAEDIRRFDEGLNPSPPRVTYMSELTGVDLDFKGMKDFASLRRAANLNNPVKSAIIAPLDFQYGFARMFQTMNDHPLITIKIFRDEDAALAWLREGSRPPQA